MSESAPPGREQLIEVDSPSLDEQEVLRHFLGKTQAEASGMFRERRGALAGDYLWMSPGGLRYYLPAAYDYLRSGASSNDWEFCHGLLGSLSFQARFELPQDVGTMIRAVARFADLHRAKFNVEFGDRVFNDHLREIRKPRHET